MRSNGQHLIDKRFHNTRRSLLADHPNRIGWLQVKSPTLKAMRERGEVEFMRWGGSIATIFVYRADEIEISMLNHYIRLQIFLIFLASLAFSISIAGNAQDIYGCMSPFAPNYNPAATINDYSCDYDIPQLLADGYCIQELLDGGVWYYDFPGIQYGGGYIRHVSEFAGKALISSGINVGTFEWGCYQTSVDETSMQEWMGEENTLQIVSHGCTDVADAAIAAYQFSQNGYLISFCRLWAIVTWEIVRNVVLGLGYGQVLKMVLAVLIGSLVQMPFTVLRLCLMMSSLFASSTWKMAALVQRHVKIGCKRDRAGPR